MIIVSQNKKEIVNMQNVTHISIMDAEEDGFIIAADTNSAESMVWDLGYYKTEERAKEVLQNLITITINKGIYEDEKVIYMPEK